MTTIDLHIHSKASEYKEAQGVVENSDINHLDVLFDKLRNNKIDLISITDHNRFDPELYRAIDQMILYSRPEYPKQIVAGVEFDVQLEKEKKSCHVIAIFDANNETSNYEKIANAINADRLEKPNEYYTRDRFESILKRIGLPVILIAHQKSSLDRSDDRNRSLSASVEDPIEYIYGGYISALEFSRPNQEGILKSNLKDMPKLAPLLTGSDCHQWEYYPSKDNTSSVKCKPTVVEVLPTFKGLHIAITSPENRIEPKSHTCEYPLKSFSENGEEHSLKNGLIAIIGENGSGKSTLMEFLAGQKPKPHQKMIRDANTLRIDDKLDASKIKILRQGEIVDLFNNDTLFPPDFFDDVNHELFRDTYQKYSKDLKKAIESRISYFDAVGLLDKKEFKLSGTPDLSTYYVDVTIPNEFTNLTNEHKSKLEDVRKIIRQICELLSDKYYLEYQAVLKNALNILKDVEESVHRNYSQVAEEIGIKNKIEEQVTSYRDRISTLTSSEELEKQKYRSFRQSFVDSIVDVFNRKSQIVELPKSPDKVPGYSEKQSKGFKFTKKSDYHDQDVHSEFIRAVFNQEYQSVDRLLSIKTKDEFVKAVTGCTDPQKLDQLYEKNVNDFITSKSECKGYIIDSSKERRNIGNTLGEMSLAYLRYLIQNDDEHPVVFLDQPEDHISNHHVSKELIGYFNRIRYEKQVFIVTHNPLLVVNLDVDQVVFLKKVNNNIQFISGPLERDDSECNMLEIIASNMDGGKEAIQKRMKVYE